MSILREPRKRPALDGRSDLCTRVRCRGDGDGTRQIDSAVAEFCHDLGGYVTMLDGHQCLNFDAPQQSVI